MARDSVASGSTHPDLEREVRRQLILAHGMTVQRRCELDRARATMRTALEQGDKAYCLARKGYAELSNRTRKEFEAVCSQDPADLSGSIRLLRSARRRGIVRRADGGGGILWPKQTAPLQCPEPEPGPEECLELTLSADEGGFNTSGDPTVIQQGLVGFGSTSGRLALFENRNGGNVETSLRLTWSGTAPATDDYRLDVTTPTVIASGMYTLTGDGWIAGSESSLMVNLFYRFSVGASVIPFVGPVVALNGTPDVTKVGWLQSLNAPAIQFDLPTDITFSATQGDSIEYSVSLMVSSYASQFGTVRLDVSLFGIPANLQSDAAVRVCR